MAPGAELEQAPGRACLTHQSRAYGAVRAAGGGNVKALDQLGELLPAVQR